MNMDNFCPAPWMSFFYQMNEACVCCANADRLNLSPKEFRESEYLKALKKQFLANERPKSCDSCFNREDKNLISIRTHYQRNFPKYTREFFNEDTELPIELLELRSSNLCNFKCRMCFPKNSVEIAREIAETPDLNKHYDLSDIPITITETEDTSWEQILEMSLHCTRLFFSGGEPMLLKKYYDLLDHLIEHKRTDKVLLDIYTNCSVNNPKFIDRVTQFDKVRLNYSIDGVGKVAEYQRHGTVWDTVKNNVISFNKIPGIMHVVQTTLTAYNILDLSNLADFYLQLLEDNSKLEFMLHVSQRPQALYHVNLPKPLKEKAIEQLDMAIKKLTGISSFYIICREFTAIKKQLTDNTENGKGFLSFAHMTRTYDKSRNEKFEDVFNFKLY